MPFLVLVSMLGLVLTYHIRSIYLGLFLVLLSILLFSAVTFVSNYLAARKHRLPILVVSGTWQNPVSYLLDPLLSPILAGDHFGWELMTRYSRQCWALRYNGWIHGKHGPAIALVSAANNEIMVDDPAAAKMVISKWTTWVKKPTLYRVSDVFGPKVTSVNDPTWRRHRKISTVAFTAERNYGAVWDASVVQVEGMAAKWMRRGEMTIKDVASDARVLALHVLSAAAFGHPVHSFEDGEQNPPAGRQMTFHTAIAIITDNILTTMLFAAPSLPRWLPLPSILRELVVAVNEVKAYMAEEVQETKEAVRRGEFDKRPPNLMSALVQASELAKRENGGGGGKEEKTGKTASARGGVAGGLSDDELYADLFDLSRAGYETTASTLSFAIPYLAAFDDVQDWLREEIDEVFGSLNLDEGSHLAIGKYREVFPRLKRCRAVMYETLRLNSPVQAFPTYPCDDQQPKLLTLAMTTDDKSTTTTTTTYEIPPRTIVTVNAAAVHTDQASWGTAAQIWRPWRWIDSPLTANPKSQTTPIVDVLAAETFRQPPTAPPGAFLGWSLGPRECPGKKFSLVEFVAVISVLLRRYTVRMPAQDGETLEDFRERVMCNIHSRFFCGTLRWSRPEVLGVELEPRKKR